MITGSEMHWLKPAWRMHERTGGRRRGLVSREYVDGWRNDMKVEGVNSDARCKMILRW